MCCDRRSQVRSMKFILIGVFLISADIGSPQWNWNRIPPFGFRNDRSFKSNARSRAPTVPFQKKGQEHTLGGPSWDFERAMGRASGRFQADVLVNGIPYSKSGYRGSARLYSIEIVESGVTFMNVMTNGGSGDVDIYVRRDEYPTKRNYDARSAHPGNQEQIIIDNPNSGRYFIVLYGFDPYDDVGFEAEYR